MTNPGEVVDAVDERQTNGQLGADDVEDDDQFLPHDARVDAFDGHVEPVSEMVDQLCVDPVSLGSVRFYVKPVQSQVLLKGILRHEAMVSPHRQTRPIGQL